MDIPSPPVPPVPPAPPPPRRSGGIMGGLILILIGLLFLLDRFLPGFSFGDFWPLILIVIGAGIIWNARRGE